MMPAQGAEPLMIACCQLRLQVGDVEGNHRRIEEAVERAAGRSAKLVVLPELAATGYAFRDLDEAKTLAEPVPGPTTRAWQRLAATHHVTIVGGLCERGSDEMLYNTAVIVDATGISATYRKVHLWDTEKEIFTPGRHEPPVVDVDGHRVGLMICYDVEFPEWVRLPALAGAELLCVPVNWPQLPRPRGERPAEIVRVQASASVNRMFIAVCDRTGQEHGIDWVGGSVIIDPDGWPLAGPPTHDEEILLAQCPLADARDKSISERNNVLTDRKPGLYTRIIHHNPKDPAT